MTGDYTRTEILSQPEVWAAALDTIRQQAATLRAFYRDGRYDQLIFTGCGSTYYLALAAASVTQQLVGTPARGVPASEAWLYPGSVYPSGQRTLLVAVSRSGETTETLRAGEAFLAQNRGDFLTLSCYPDKALAHQGTLNLVFPEAQEESVAQTRAFSTLYLATTALAALWAGREDLLGQMEKLPGAGRRLLDTYTDLPVQLGRDEAIDRFYFLGSGPRYGLACELSLKMKEMSLSHSEPFHFMEFRHGPMSMVTPSTLLVGMLSEQNRSREQAVVDEMAQRGARLLVMAESGAEVEFQSGVDEAVRNVLYLPMGQLVAFERSLSKSFNPDRPHNLDAVVRL
jgi:glucosamine--fructose-6-phosphate aminotransferase (isomerizing)